MEQLTRTEIMLIKGCVLAEKRSLEAELEKADPKLMGPIDITNYAYNKNLVMQYDAILSKLG